MANKLVVAIIDDDESIRMATSRLVRSLGWDARTYASAQAFLDAGETDTVECILSDVQMPKMSGLEMLRNLNAHGTQIPIVFITGFCTDAIRKEALRAGAHACLSKPADSMFVQQFLEEVASGARGHGLQH